MRIDIEATEPEGQVDLEMRIERALAKWQAQTKLQESAMLEDRARTVAADCSPTLVNLVDEQLFAGNVGCFQLSGELAHNEKSEEEDVDVTFSLRSVQLAHSALDRADDGEDLDDDDEEDVDDDDDGEDGKDDDAGMLDEEDDLEVDGDDDGDDDGENEDDEVELRHARLLCGVPRVRRPQHLAQLQHERVPVAHLEVEIEDADVLVPEPQYKGPQINILADVFLAEPQFKDSQVEIVADVDLAALAAAGEADDVTTSTSSRWRATAALAA